jgi:hypothetical protein
LIVQIKEDEHMFGIITTPDGTTIDNPLAEAIMAVGAAVGLAYGLGKGLAVIAENRSKKTGEKSESTQKLGMSELLHELKKLRN